MTTIDCEEGTISGSWPHRRIRPPDDELSLLRLLSDGLSRLDRSLERRRSRRHLLELSDDLLRDIGVTRDQARAEADRSILF